MCWNYESAGYFKEWGWIDRKKECDRRYSGTVYHGESYEVIATDRVIKSSLVGRTWYGAVERTYLDGRKVVYAGVALVREALDWKIGIQYGSEFSPLGDGCPISILDLLSPTNNENAIKWRERCRENAAENAFRRKLFDLLEDSEACWTIPKKMSFKSGKEIEAGSVVRLSLKKGKKNRKLVGYYPEIGYFEIRPKLISKTDVVIGNLT